MLRHFVTTLLLLLALTLLAPGVTLAQDPSPRPTPGASPIFIDPLDPRAGEGASQVGAPLLAFVVVLALGSLAAGATYLYVRLVRSR